MTELIGEELDHPDYELISKRLNDSEESFPERANFMIVLIVDDDSRMRKLLGIRLRDEGFEVIESESAIEAYQYLGLSPSDRVADASIDLILMDVLMSGITGIEACCKIKAHSKTHDIPIIMMTASTDLKFLQAAFDAGAMDFLSKPFRKQELSVRIRAAIRLKSEIDQRKQHEQELEKIAEQLREANRKLEKLSAMDGLTGLYNRRHFDVTLEKEFQSAMRSQSSLSLLMIDVDKFKGYNDIYGHPAGDSCLKRVAETFETVVSRTNDLVARYGGEEFAVILPQTAQTAAFTLAETLRKQVMKLNIEHTVGISNIVTISVGVASRVPNLGSTSAELISQADQALYESKGKGRNCVTIARLK